MAYAPTLHVRRHKGKSTLTVNGFNGILFTAWIGVMFPLLDITTVWTGDTL